MPYICLLHHSLPFTHIWSSQLPEVMIKTKKASLKGVCRLLINTHGASAICQVQSEVTTQDTSWKLLILAARKLLLAPTLEMWKQTQQVEWLKYTHVAFRDLRLGPTPLTPRLVTPHSPKISEVDLFLKGKKNFIVGKSGLSCPITAWKIKFWNPPFVYHEQFLWLATSPVCALNKMEVLAT